MFGVLRRCDRLGECLFYVIISDETNSCRQRHPLQGSVGSVVATPGLTVPILNAGDGIGEHPTQALLDVYTMYSEARGAVRSQLTVVLVGDLRNGRTVHSLARLLAKVTRGILWQDSLVLRYCAPEGLGIPKGVYDYVADCAGVTQEECNSLSIDTETDVLYVTRVQKERFETQEDYEKVKGSYVVNKATMDQAPSHMIVLHPLPRVDEIATEVDEDPRAAYFRQMENGMHVRMALLSLILARKET